jgi:fatty-acyl-CoA synthase
MDADTSSGPALPQDLPPPAPAEALAILYTSGTTGHPKGAMHSHAGMMHTAINQQAALGLTPHDRHLIVSPLAFTGGILTSVQPALYTGGAILLEPDFDPARLLRRMATDVPTIFMAVPTMLRLLLDEPAFTADAFATIRYLGSGSAPAPLDLLHRYLDIGVRIGHAYGLTEGGGLATQLRPSEAFERLGSAGRACGSVELRIVDADGRDLPAGEVGEIVQRGPSNTLGYWRDEAGTAALFLDADREWLRTGDLGRIDADGYLCVAGRAKDVVITGGMNVYPGDVEAVLAGHPAISESAVLGVPHPVYGETVLAVVVLRPGAQLTLGELREFCSGRLADYKIPRLLQTVAELPRTASGKVLKSALHAPPR